MDNHFLQKEEVGRELYPMPRTDSPLYQDLSYSDLQIRWEFDRWKCVSSHLENMRVTRVQGYDAGVYEWPHVKVFH